MSVGIRISSACRILLSAEFFMARRPVLDRRQRLFAHELVFCAVEEGAAGTDGDAGGASGPAVIEDVCRHGLPRVLGDLPGIVRVGEAAVLSDVILQFPAALTMLELCPDRLPSPALQARCEQLAAAGYCFALRGEGDGASLETLPAPAMIIVDIGGKDDQVLKACIDRWRPLGTQVCAAGVDTREQYRRCLALGFDCFQGYFFTEPELQQGKGFAPSQLAIVELLALLATDADEALVERVIKANVPLSLSLLRLANAPAFTTHPIDSLRQAMMALGRNQLQRWLHMLLYEETPGRGSPVQALGSLAAARGRLMELAAQALMPGNRGVADTAFTVGIMSLMDTLFGMPMEDILREVKVVEEVRDALLQRQGLHGKLLNLAVGAESLRHPEQLRAAAREARLSCNDLYLLQLAAFEWSDHAGRILHEPN
ncbi:EAL and HDOD domain-containing protein [Noviherbaspirillum aridicola]|uniref:Cyclic diguanylate phosphodiesterase n=1 Tax=Noviherbaspirillum aridicola TaxID=2849687 RepID=A0ABQ4PYN2_9BURK|nr:EAL domain-containing protein [Noviherbaspirillum aridicola]GIZ50003.1 cyclic diguanylate phosphodiesterase [Noviherbaspirillum aridicola]